MTRFGKLFGKKAEQPAAEDQAAGSLSLPPAEGLSHTAAGMPTAANTGYGIKFFFDGGESQVFTRLPIRIGRSEENDLVINDPTISANHALVYFDEHLKEICIQDLDSLNGVFVADGPTRKNILEDGARIGLGQFHLIFRDTGYIHPV